MCSTCSSLQMCYLCQPIEQIFFGFLPFLTENNVIIHILVVWDFDVLLSVCAGSSFRPHFPLRHICATLSRFISALQDLVTSQDLVNVRYNPAISSVGVQFNTQLSNVSPEACVWEAFVFVSTEHKKAGTTRTVTFRERDSQLEGS